MYPSRDLLWCFCLCTFCKRLHLNYHSQISRPEELLGAALRCTAAKVSTMDRDRAQIRTLDSDSLRAVEEDRPANDPFISLINVTMNINTTHSLPSFPAVISLQITPMCFDLHPLPVSFPFLRDETGRDRGTLVSGVSSTGDEGGFRNSSTTCRGGVTACTSYWVGKMGVGL